MPRYYRRRYRKRYRPSIKKTMYRIANAVIASNEETHYLDTSIGGGGTATVSWNFVPLSEVPVGDTAVTRTGDEIKPSGLHVDVLFAKNASTVVTMAGKVRFVIFQLKIPFDSSAAAQPVYSLLFEEDNFLSLYSHNMDNVHILADKKAEITYYNGTAELKFTIPLYKIRKYKYDNKLTFTNADVTGEETEFGSLWAGFCSDQSTAGNQPYITARTRLTWKE